MGNYAIRFCHNLQFFVINQKLSHRKCRYNKGNFLSLLSRLTILIVINTEISENNVVEGALLVNKQITIEQMIMVTAINFI